MSGLRDEFLARRGEVEARHGALLAGNPGGRMVTLALVVVSLAVYALALWKLGAFDTSEVALAREAGGFLKPFLAKWSRQPQHTPV